jgi:Fe-S cluster biogenesis protein NfuA/nitrite reductase/ring-hydroxylating ferredoxin subunit
MAEEKELQRKIQRIEELVGKIQSIADPVSRASAHELVQSLMDLHGAGIERMMEITADVGPQGMEIIDRLATDKLVASLLLLYGLHPLDLETRVLQALDKVRPYLQSHGGNVDFVGVDDGVLRLRLQGSCHGCGSSAETLKLAIEEAVYDAAPDITGLHVEGVVEAKSPAVLVQLGSSVAVHRENPAAWEEVAELKSLATGSVRTMEVAGRSVLFCRVGETFYAYNTNCPGCGQTLEGACLEATALICPTCKEQFDVARAGRSLSQPGIHIDPFPLLMHDDRARIALPVQ